MTLDQTIVFAVLIVTLVLFITETWRYDVVAFMALMAVTLMGIVPADQAFIGFGHAAVITVAAVLVLSRALQNSGVIDFLAGWTSRVGNGPSAQVGAFTSLVALLSAFINNVGALALLLPVTIRTARKTGHSPALLLMPLAFASLLGGMTTLIGTPPNIIIAAFRAESAGEPFHMFDFAPVGAVVAVVGIIYMALVGWRLVPQRNSLPPREELFHIADYISELRVPKESKIVGRPLMELESMTDSDIAVVGVVRGELKVPAPSSYEPIRSGDIVIVQANSEGLKELISAAQLELAEEKESRDQVLGSEQVILAEAIVKPDSQIEGNTATTLQLRWRYGINLLGVARHGVRMTERLKNIFFEAGDILLFQGSETALQQALPMLGCLPLADRGLRMERPSRLLLAIGIFACAVMVVALGKLAAPVAFVGAAGLMIVTGLISINDAYRAIDWPIIVLLGAMIPVAQALESTGGAELIAVQLFQLAHGVSAQVIVLVVLVATMFLSDLVNNAAAALLMAPIALRLATEVGASADPFLMAVAIGASCAFLTPIGHQSNALVMGPGGYRFGDYWRMGLPLEIAIAAMAMPLILWHWPLGK
ncbi:MAG: SLC13 family permease [Candidatus Binatia bacterium]